ncbi:hypothetical protein A3D84_03705 [Candidatus Woesebacteria bacterium RIFCSPHIGHO2_02_FULL_42_20]|uniref:PIN domain-containing protein n=1 Tax=Candidatus Woesebacteria bacterium RIFCSPHIGHO2_12_FULL_41_24 TaxID=1802510 RepID=A0A1F8AUE1_9BACT|nr:MAG: hypothetical protein A2W15_03855 [Candidatus Woesebacteria bacterium RBG_16_41_13]OGM29158.1 MAG: hypothetical protein A2873_01460 [Candidatus Woesebacteria bacterium RIFCSPHIGHO2_01_FULL_42_80]OGM35639.1 MAG: hypothetical protein A3D84_03705 [Candidatus Woesebacteria bacterium RIFCSPHIGHO2_02_FULL_42_20]OGM55250.1 MAG: hypothetical protein A3E44_03115 [Candidatus Woesebacteria bacterium RIFCSPHIGHO2_12_FULL_41_24]OGM67204.1 MAG: hypothetical protein A2969_04840 [Candidatus Woesebacteri
MATYLDTNYLVRFLTKDIKVQAETAKKIIENDKIYIANIVLAEVVYILETHYKANKKELCNVLISLIKQPNVSTSSFVPLSLNIYKNERVSFYDSLLLAEVLNSKSQLKSFDKKLLKTHSKYK